MDMGGQAVQILWSVWLSLHRTKDRSACFGPPVTDYNRRHSQQVAQALDQPSAEGPPQRSCS
eukprot:5697384-Pyramimonas_sp.AAC.1